MPLTRTLVSSTTLGRLGSAPGTPDLAKSAIDGLVQFALREVFGLLSHSLHHPAQLFSRGQRLTQLAHISLERFHAVDQLIDFCSATRHRRSLVGKSYHESAAGTGCRSLKKRGAYRTLSTNRAAGAATRARDGRVDCVARRVPAAFRAVERALPGRRRHTRRRRTR